MSIYSLVNKFSAQGISLWEQDGQLKFKAPNGALTDDLREELIANKEDIIALLQRVSKKRKIPPILPVSRTGENGLPIESFPLSFAQQRLWVINQLDPDTAGYNIRKAVTIDGELDIECLELAFNLIIARHENLRTIFTSQKGEAQQVVLDSFDFKLENVDLSQTKTNKTRHEKAQQLCQSEAATPFDLTRGPLVRGKLIKLAKQEHILMLTMHHIISDGWSTGVMIKEFGLIMGSLQQGRCPDLAPLPIQYLDYSIWQRKLLGEGLHGQESLFQKQLTYWQEKLTGIPENLNLVADYPRRSVQDFSGARHAFRLDAQLTRQLTSLAEQQGCTLYMTLLAVFKVLLYRYTGQEDICLGSPIANRQYEKTENLIGMFVNTLALRSQLEGDASFISLLAQVKATCLEAYEHQDIPFEKIVDLVQPGRNLALSPLFQIMFALQNAPKESTEQHIRPYPLKSDVSKFDLTIVFTETQEELEGLIDYRTSLYNPQTIERMAQHFRSICQAIISTPSAKISELEFIDEVEKQQLLIDYNDTQTEYPKDECIHQLFIEQVSINPDKISVVYQDGALSYQQLYDKSCDLALYLQSLGVKPDTLVGLCVERSLETIVGILGILQAGGAYVPLDPDYPDDRLAYMLQDSEASIVLTQEKIRGKLTASIPKNTQLITLDTQWPEISHCVADLKAKKVILQKAVKAHHLAYVIYTSGSTGQPKGVEVEHSGVVAFLSNPTYVDVTKVNKVASFSSFAFDGFVFDLFLSLSTGSSLYLYKSDDYLLPAQFQKNMQRDEIDTFFVTTALFNQLVENDSLQNSSIRQILFGGEKCDLSYVEKFQKRYPDIRLIHVYGPTETIVYASFCELNKQIGTAPIGKAINNNKLVVLNDRFLLTPVGAIGELYIGGDSLARGYLNSPALTAERFIANPYYDSNEPSSTPRLYRTGDLVRILPDGNLAFCGRADSQVKIRGFRIEFGEIEARLNQYPEIKGSVVIVHDQNGNKNIIAYYVASDTTQDQIINLTNEDLRAWLQQTLPKYMLPAAFVRLETIPLTTNGKADRRALESRDVNLESSQTYQPPRSATEKQLVAIWADVLNIEPEKIGVNDNFFELGGDSIKIIQVVSKAVEHQIHFDIRDMFNYLNISALLKHCDTTKSREILKEDGVLQGAVDLSPIQSYFFKYIQTDIHHFNQSVLVNLDVNLSIKDLQELIGLLVEQHDVLRLRYTKGENGWQQHYLGSDAITSEMLGLHIHDVANFDEKQIPSYVEKTCVDWQASLNIENGPLMRWVYFDFKGNGSDQLAIIIHHLLVDGVSWRILLEDFNLLIGQKLAKQKTLLSNKRSSYRNWVDSLASYKDSNQGQKDLQYWVEQSNKTQHMSNAFVAKTYRTQDIQRNKVLLSKANTEKLLKHCHQAYGTDINDLLLTAVMQSYYQATGNKELMIKMEGHGRDQINPAIDITKTMGWFTSIFPVGFQLSNPEDIGQSIKEVKTVLHGIPNKGVGFSIFRYINRHNAIENIPEAQVVFNFLGDFQSSEKESAKKYFSFSENPIGKTDSERQEVNSPVTINGLVAFEQLSFTFSYPKEWAGQQICRWQDCFILALESLIDECHDSPRMGYTPSDFPLLNASSSDLEQVTQDLKEQKNIKLENIQDIYPLSSLQAGMLFETLFAQTEENKGMYLTQSAIGLNSQVDIQVLQQAWQLILNHYDALRMLVIPANISNVDVDLQVILKQVDIHINRVDWTEKNHAGLKYACEQWMIESKRSGISLDQAPMMRISLFQGQESCYMLFEHHHMMLDGWSRSIILSNLFKVYQALAQRQDYQLPPSAPYGAYVQASLNRSQEEETLYWGKYLTHYEESTPLPLNHLAPRKNIAGDVFNSSKFYLSQQDSIKLEQLVKKHQLTMNTILQFIWGLLLHLHSGNKAVTFGSVSSGRTGIVDTKHVDQMVGMCINTTPTCIQFDADYTLLDQLKQMQSRESEKLSHELTPLIRIQKLLGISTNKNFFQTLFVYENYPVEEVSGATSMVKDVIGHESPNFPLSISALSKGKLHMTFTYDAYYYSEETIITLIEQFERLILQLIADPEATIKEVSLISAQEKQQLLIDYNNTQADYPKDQCIHQLFIEQVGIHPDKTAVVYQDETLSYQQLYDKSHDLALYLQSLGVKPDSLVGLYVERSLEMLVGILGILQAGGAYVPLDPDLPDDRLAYMLQDSQATIILSQEKLKNKLSDLVAQDTQLIALDQQWSDVSECAADLKIKQIKLQQEIKPYHLAYVIYTSGSTGQPKGVMVEHQSVMNYLNYCVSHYFPKQNNEYGSFIHFPLSFDASVTSLFSPLILGKTIVINSESNIDFFKDGKFLDKGYDFIKLTPSHLLLLKNNLSNISKKVFKKKNLLILGGEALTSDHVDFLNMPDVDIELINEYGPTEATVGCTTARLSANRLKGATLEATNNIAIGTPIANTQIYILDQHANPVPSGVPGELHIAGAGLVRGYLNRPELTEEKFIPNPFNPGTRMYKSGDLARWLDDGNIEYLGRIDTQVKIRGFRIELGEIETRLNQYPEVKDSVVITRGQDSNKNLIAYYVASSNTHDQITDLNNRDLKAHLQHSLPDYMLPVAFVSLEAIPLTPNGKVDRHALARMDVSLESSQAYLAPRNEMEKQLVAIWAEVLKLDPHKIGANDNFFELGGHSLLATQVVSKIRSQLEIDVPLKMLFNASTVAGMSEVTHAIKVQHEKSSLDVDLTDVEFEETSL